jgi:hypothetical protein
MNQTHSNGRGGARRGAGRPKGSKNAATKKARAVSEQAAAEGITPLEYMLDIMRTEVSEDMDARELLTAITLRFEAAKAAAPYIHPRLAAVEHSGNLSVTLAHELAALNRAI